MWLCQDASGDLAEAQGGTAFAHTGTPNYSLGSPFSLTKKAVGSTGAGNSFALTEGTTLDPAGASYTYLLAFRVESTRSATTAVFSKYAAGKGFVLNVDAAGALNLIYGDGALLEVKTAAKQYGRGAYHVVAVSFDSVGNTMTFYSGEETYQQATPGGWSWAGFTTPGAAEILLASGLGQSGDGQLAYVAGFAGKITQVEYDAWLSYGTFAGLTGVEFTPGAGTNVGLGTYDFQTPAFPRVRSHAHSQVPLDARSGTVGVLASASKVNYVLNGEYLADAINWSTSGAGLAVTAHQAADPGFGFAATKLDKAAAGVTPSRRQVISPQAVSGFVMGSAWIWTTDGGTREATLRVTYGGDLVEVKTSTVVVTSVPQLVHVISSEITFAAGTSFIIDVFPTDSTDNAETGSVFVWGVQISAEAEDATLPLSYSPYGSTEGSTAPGRIGGTGAVTGTSGYVNMQVYTAGPAPDTENQLVVLDEGSGDGGMSLDANDGTGSLHITVRDDLGNALVSENYWDIKVAYETIGTRLCLTPHWSFPRDKVRLGVQGGTVGGRIDVIDPAPSWPSSLSTDWRLGADDVNDLYPNLVYEKITFGSSSGTLTTNQLIAFATAALGSAPVRVAYFGDSITEFFDGPHSKLMRLLGVEACTVCNYGWSGNYLADSGVANGDLLVRVPSLANGLWDYIVVDAGRNDIGNGSFTGAQTLAHLDSVIAALLPLGAQIYVNTLSPNKGCEATFPGYWSAGKQVYIDDFNAGVNAVPTGVDAVSDLFAALTDGSDAWAGFPVTTYDHLHPTHGVSGNPGPGADDMGQVVFDEAFNGTPL